jgi:hypothetical protein
MEMRKEKVGRTKGNLATTRITRQGKIKTRKKEEGEKSSEPMEKTFQL